MYDVADTIVAVSSPSGGVRSIIRITGPQTLPTCEQLFESTAAPPIRNPQSAIRDSIVVSGSVRINNELAVDARLYLFFAPHSYTGDDLAEMHVHASPVLVEALVRSLLAGGLRPAGPGEFTARAYLNGKLDLAQAEAVNEIVSSSNRLQLEAAQKLLSGRLTQTAEEIRSAMLDCLSLLEAGLDFSGEEIEFLGAEQAAGRLADIQRRLEELLAGSIRYETLVDLPAIGIAGAPNAGKSSLLNALLGWERSIVSGRPKTTRDVLSGLLTTDRFQCVLFDCAGLVPAPDNVLDELAQRAALEALRHCTAVLFCVDVTKTDLGEDVVVRAGIPPKNVIGVATKCDLPTGDELPRRMERLAGTFGATFLPTSAKTGQGRQELLDAIAQSAIINPQSAITPLALTARHKQAVTEAMENIRQAATEVQRGNEEVAAMMIRAAHQAISQIEQQHIDEQVLDRIFRRFCLGK
jgi:tRNA modification GTPase